MSRMPGTNWVGEQSPRTPMSQYDIVCVHTIVGYAPAHAAHFSTHADGQIDQSRDTAYRSAANLNGNHRVIANENEDHGDRFGGTPHLPGWVPLTPEQVEANARILAWAHKEHGVPLQLCPDSRPGSRGLAYHRQGIDGNFGDYQFSGRVSGGEIWTESFGKVCPCDIRIAQLPEILARAKQIVTPTPDPQPQEDDMFSDKDRATLNELAKDLSVFRASTANRDQAAAEREKEMLTDLDNVTAGLKSLEEGKATAGSIGALSEKVSRVRQRLADKIDRTHKETA